MIKKDKKLIDTIATSNNKDEFTAQQHDKINIDHKSSSIDHKSHSQSLSQQQHLYPSQFQHQYQHPYSNQHQQYPRPQHQQMYNNYDYYQDEWNGSNYQHSYPYTYPYDRNYYFSRYDEYERSDEGLDQIEGQSRQFNTEYDYFGYNNNKNDNRYSLSTTIRDNFTDKHSSNAKNSLNEQIKNNNKNKENKDNKESSAVWTANQVQKQLEYWFNDDNLRKDNYLITLMDNEGWVDIARITMFSRMKAHGGNFDKVLQAASHSSHFQVHSNGKKYGKKTIGKNMFARLIIMSLRILQMFRKMISKILLIIL